MNMLEILFRYCDNLSKGNWNIQGCSVPSVQECIEIYGLGIDCNYRIEKIRFLDPIIIEYKNKTYRVLQLIKGLDCGDNVLPNPDYVIAEFKYQDNWIAVKNQQICINLAKIIKTKEQKLKGF